MQCQHDSMRQEHRARPALTRVATTGVGSLQANLADGARAAYGTVPDITALLRGVDALCAAGHLACRQEGDEQKDVVRRVWAKFWCGAAAAAYLSGRCTC